MPKAALIEADDPWWNVSLTSGWLIALFVVLAVGAMVAAGWTWDVERLKRTRRSALLVAIQVLTALTLGAAINVAGGFYGSLADLFGAPRDAGPVVRADNGAGPVVPVEPWLAKARRDSGPGKGVWTSLTIAGKRTGYRLPAWIYVPDSYFDPSHATRQFPVSIVLSGYPAPPEIWEQAAHLAALLDKLIANGRIPPMIFVAVTQDPVPHRDSECVDVVGGTKADTYISQDVPDVITQHLRIIADRSAWSTLGYSTGGYCAVDLALRHPHEFSSVICLDGYFVPANDATTGDLFKHNAAVQRSFTPLRTILDKRDVPLRFYLLVGDAETNLEKAGRAFAAEVRPPDTVTVVNIPGGHNWGTWAAALPAALAWLAAALPDTPSGTPSALGIVPTITG